MRTYLRNSPQAAARIVALAALADGHLCKAELDRLDRLGVCEQLDLPPRGFPVVLHALCDDLPSTVSRTAADSCRVDPRTLADQLAEVDDPGLRIKVLRLCVAVVEADGLVGDGESAMLATLAEHWRLRRVMPQPGFSVRVVEPV